MKTDLIINSKAGNKAVAKTITNVNPEVTNDKLETFAGMVNALSTNTYNSASRVDKKDVTEADTPTPSAGKRIPTLTVTDNGQDYGTITYDGDGTLEASLINLDKSGHNQKYICGVTISSDSKALYIDGTDRSKPGIIWASETDNCSPVWTTFVITGSGPT